MSWKPYPAYKDSGVEPACHDARGAGRWLGKIPAHWEIDRLRRFAEIGNGSTPKRDNLDYWLDGTIPWLNSAKINDEVVKKGDQFVSDTAMRECHLPLLEPDTVLVAITGEGQTRGRAALLRIRCTISQHLASISIKRRARLLPTFLWRFLQGHYDWLRYESSGGGSTKAALTCEFLQAIPAAIPPTEEQSGICRYIDRETAKLDALIAKVHQGIEKSSRNTAWPSSPPL